MVKIVVDNHKCIGCSTYVNTCPVGVYEVEEGKSVPIKPEECLVCRDAKLNAQKTPHKSLNNSPARTANTGLCVCV